MAEKNPTLITYQTFFLSKETSRCPLIAPVITFYNTLQKQQQFDIKNSVISLTFGRRLLTTTQEANTTGLTPEDFVEIVDYDPIKNTLVVLGKHDPSYEAPIHFIIQNARHDVHALFQITNQEVYNRGTQKKFPTQTSQIKGGPLEHAKAYLKLLQTNKTILIHDDTVLFTGINLKEIQENLQNLYQEK